MAPGRLTSRQVNLLLEVLVVTSLVTGLVSWAVPLSTARPILVIHAVSGTSILLLGPSKISGSVRVGFARRRAGRYVSAGMGGVVVATAVLGYLHATGLWFGVGHWSALWTHVVLGLASVPLVVWHVWSRPVRPRATDRDRRALLGAGATAAVATGVVIGQELSVRALDLAGRDRAGTGSHELGSFDPERMPSVIWFDDTRPDLPLEDWPLTIDGRPADLAAIADGTSPVVAALDCTGGWWSEQAWDAVPLSALVGPGEGRSVKVTSATGYTRWFSNRASAGIYLATGYNGVPLARRHGAPARIVAPGRRGPWWIKWVVSIERSDRPAWAQLPLPPT